MRRAAAVAVTVLLTVLLTPGRSVAIAAPTISAPPVVRYWTPFTISGSAMPVGSTVRVYSRRTGQASFHLARTLTSDGSGHYAASVRIDASTAYYATANGLKSPTVTAHVKTTTCTTSDAAFSRLPFASHQTPAFAAFTATRLGTWAGMAYDGDAGFAVLTWRRGQPLHVLGRFDYHKTTFAARAGGSVTVVGILPNGGVVAAVQRTEDFRIARFVGFVYLSGHRYQLRAAPSWLTVDPVGVTSTGAIVAAVMWHDGAGRERYAVVSWASATAAPHVVVKTGSQPPYPVVDRQGDIAYYADVPRIRLASGDIRTVADGFSPWVSGASTIYGTTSTLAIAAVNLTNPAVSGPLPWWQVTGPTTSIPIAAGPHGQLLFGHDRPTRMLTAGGALPTLPAIMPGDLGLNPGEAIDQYGTVAFTSRRDGLIHFFRCA